jgi:hypothetical protein
MGKLLQAASASGHVLTVKALLRSEPLSTQELMQHLNKVGQCFGLMLITSIMDNM